MALFVVRHRHSPDSCPARPGFGEQLLSHVSASTAASYGMAIQAEAVLDGEHELMLIVEAADVKRVEAFMAFLGPFGSIEVLPASSAETAVQRGGCEPGTHDNRIEESSTENLAGVKSTND